MHWLKLKGAKMKETIAALLPKEDKRPEISATRKGASHSRVFPGGSNPFLAHSLTCPSQLSVTVCLYRTSSLLCLSYRVDFYHPARSYA